MVDWDLLRRREARAQRSAQLVDAESKSAARVGRPVLFVVPGLFNKSYVPSDQKNTAAPVGPGGVAFDGGLGSAAAAGGDALQLERSNAHRRRRRTGTASARSLCWS
jgi:hypothetical protein